jgi:hypothetical protein
MRVVPEYRTMLPEGRPQDPTLDGRELKFETLAHGGEYPDMMPQAIRVTNAHGRSAIYVPLKVDGRVAERSDEPKR